jgi:peptidoglycan/LPS O-acetylase OafA/YrhL
MSGPHAQERNFGLDVARLTACSLVLVAHYTAIFVPLFGGQPPVAVVLSAYWGVELFFVLSGFLIGRLLFAIAETDPTWHGWLTFMVRRWMRTLPLYYLWLIVIPLALPLPEHFGRKLLMFATMTQNLAWPMPGDEWFNVSWSLTIEEWFYLLFSLALISAVAFTRSRRSIWAVIALFLIAPAVARLLHPATEDFQHDIFHVVLLRLDAIAYGVALARLQVQGSAVFRHPRLAAAIGVALVALFWVQAADHVWLPLNASHYMLLQMTGGSVGLCLFLAGVAALRTRVRPLAWFVGMGSRLSYGIYMMHLTIIAAVSWFAVGHHGNNPFILVVSTALIVVLPYLSYRFFEAPIMARRPPQRRPAPAREPVWPAAAEPASAPAPGLGRP